MKQAQWLSALTSRGASPRARRLCISSSIWILTFVIFLISPNNQVADSRFSVLLSESILNHGSLYFDEYFSPRGSAGLTVDESDYHFVKVKNGHIAYRFPYGTSILSLPLVFLANRFDLSAEGKALGIDEQGEVRIQRLIAAVVCALLAVVFFHTATRWLSPVLSSCAAVVGVLSSQIWSTASRGLWSVTWECLLLAVALDILAAAERRKTRVSVPLLASVLSWAYFCRPTASFSIVVISFYMIWRRRESLFGFAATGLAWLIVFIGFSKMAFGEYIPWYYRSPFIEKSFRVDAFCALLMSPSRGLLIFCPIVLVIALLLIRYRRYLSGARLLLLSVPVVVAQLVIPAFEVGWTGGHSYGPRLMTDLVPWLFLAAIIALAGRSSALRADPRQMPGLSTRLEKVALVTTCAWGIFVHGRGAISPATLLWNVLPATIDDHPSRVWDWRDPQFLRGIGTSHPTTMSD